MHRAIAPIPAVVWWRVKKKTKKKKHTPCGVIAAESCDPAEQRARKQASSVLKMLSLS